MHFSQVALICMTCIFSTILTRSFLKFTTLKSGAVSASSALWTFPAVLGSALIIAWAAEVAQFLVSQGLALAVLAWLQTLPEFAVEAVIAWNQDIPNMMANFTGSNRLLVGVGWPLIFLTAAYFYKNHTGKLLREIRLDDDHSVEAIALLLPTIYFFYVWAKGTLDIYDSVALFSIYCVYLIILMRIPAQKEGETDTLTGVPKRVMNHGILFRKMFVVVMFLSGGVILYFVVEPFFLSMKALSMVLGIETFVFVQWVAPFMSEFPEKVSAFYWARTIKLAPLALINMVSSRINQWTILASMIPIVYSASMGHISHVPLDHMHRIEIMLTIVQSLLSFLYIADMKFHWHDAVILFVLFFIQFMVPHLRDELIFVYLFFIIFELATNWRNMIVFKKFAHTMKKHKVLKFR